MGFITAVLAVLGCCILWLSNFGPGQVLFIDMSSLQLLLSRVYGKGWQQLASLNIALALFVHVELVVHQTGADLAATVACVKSCLLSGSLLTPRLLDTRRHLT